MKKLLYLIPILLLVSCARVVTYPGLLKEAHEAYEKSAKTSFISQLFYIGSNEKYDYFQISTPPFGGDNYKIKRSESPIYKRFPHKESRRPVVDELYDFTYSIDLPIELPRFKMIK